MAITQIAAANHAGTAGARTVTLATAPQAGDLIIARLGHGGTAASATMATPSSGWTTLASDQSAANSQGSIIYGRISDGTEGVTYTTASLTGSGNFLRVTVYRSSIGFPAIGSIVDQTATAHGASVTELTATAGGTLSQASTIGVAAQRCGNNTTSTLVYWDGTGTGQVPGLRASNGCTDSQIYTTAPAAAPSVRFASWPSATGSLCAVWLKETISNPAWPAGTGDTLIDVDSTSTLEDLRESIGELDALDDVMTVEIGVNPSGQYATVGERLDVALPLAGGTITAPVTVSRTLTLNAAATDPLHAVTKAQVDAAIPAAAVDAATLADGHVAVYRSGSGKFVGTASPWRGVAKIPPSTLITSFRQIAPDNVRGAETPVLYDTSGPEFATPAGTIMWVNPLTGADSNSGATTLAPKRTLQAAVLAVSTPTTILVGSVGLNEAFVRESIPAITGTSKVLGIQSVQGARVIWSGADIFDSSGWTYVAGKGWEWAGVYNPPIVTAAGSPPADQVFVDGVPYQQASAPNPPAGQFYVDTAAQKLYLGESSAWPIGQHVIEVTVRGYSTTGPTARHTKTGFFIRGIGFRAFGSDFANDVYAAVMFSGTNQLLEYCTFAYSSCSHLNTSSTTGMDVNEVVISTAGGAGAHSNAATDLSVTNTRVSLANWEQGFTIQPSPTERIAGWKLAHDVGSTFDNVIFERCRSNGLWHDVHCTNVTVTRFTALNNLGFGYTQENGGTFRGADWLLVGNGNTSFSNRDGFRFAGVKDVELWNVSSIDNLGAAMNLTEYDLTYSGSATVPTGDGDLVNFYGRNIVRCVTSRALSSPFISSNAKFGGSGSGGSTQTVAYSTDQMISPDPFASPLARTGLDYSTTLLLNSTRSPYVWATPTTPFTGTGYAHTDKLSLAQVKARGAETNSRVISDATGTDSALLDKFFPLRAFGIYRWAGLAVIPGTSTPTAGASPPDWVCDVLGIAHGSVGQQGCYRAPVPISTTAATPTLTMPSTWCPNFMDNLGPSTPTVLQALDLALRSSLIVDNGALRRYFPLMRLANPDIKILAYVNGTFSLNDPVDAAGNGGTYASSLYARDSSGNVVFRADRGAALMDITNSSWVANLVTVAQNRMATWGVDGIMFDTMGAAPTGSGYVTTLPYNSGAGHDWTAVEWVDQQITNLATINAAVPGALLMPNGTGMGSRYFDGVAPSEPLADAADKWSLVELYGRSDADTVGSLSGGVWTGGTWRTETQLKQDVDMLVDATAAGQTLACITKVWVTVTAAQALELNTFYLGLFLLGADGEHRFTYSDAQSWAGLTKRRGYDSLDLGAPSGAYTIDGAGAGPYTSPSYGAVYRREFANGTVLVNPTSSSHSASLRASMYLLDPATGLPTGSLVSSVTVQARTAQILVLP